MPILYLHDKILDTLKEHELNTFLKACSSKDLDFLQIDQSSWQLLPELKNTTVVMMNLMTIPKLKTFFDKLQSNLSRHGASVVLESDLSLKPDLFTAVNAQIAIAFTQGTFPSDKNDLNFYYSLRAKEVSLNFIGKLVKYFNKNKYNLNYDIAPYWKHITEYKYRKVVFSQIPTVLIEFNNPKISELLLNDIATCMIESMIDHYGTKLVPSDLDELEACLKETKTKKNTGPTLQTNKNITPRNNPKKRRYRRLSTLPPNDSPYNYFNVSNSQESVPKYLQHYLQDNTTSANRIAKSTFNDTVFPSEIDTISSSKEQKTDFLDQNKVEEKEARDKSSFQSFKDLKKLLEKQIP